MKFTRSPIVRRWLCACACLVLAGCGGDEGADADYSGAWQGRTSNGGTVVFTVQGAQVVALRLVDPGGEIWFAILLLVTLQMATCMRPMLAKPGERGWFTSEKQFFLAHFGHALNNAK